MTLSLGPPSRAGTYGTAARDADTLLLLSGGIDSVYCLWQHVQTGRPIRTHHVHLKQWTGRARYEEDAVERVLRWFHNQGTRTLIHHTESTTDYGHLKWIPRDNHTWGYWAGVILAAPKSRNLTKVIRTVHKDSVTEGPDSPEQQRCNEAWSRPIEFISQRDDIEFAFPMVHMTKAEVIRALPKDLLELCWWCRRPRRGKPCHKCHTCQQVDPVLGRLK